MPIIPGVESADDWLLHHKGVLEELAPVGHIEALLSDRVALGFWRLMRVTRYETLLVTYSDPNARSEDAAGMSDASGPPDGVDSSSGDDDDGDDEDDWEEIEAMMPEHARDVLHRFDVVMLADESVSLDAADALAVVDAVRGRVCGFPLSSFAVPDTDNVPLTECADWTAGLVRRTIRAICERFDKDPAAEISRALDVYRDMAAAGPSPTSSCNTSPASSTLNPLVTHPLPPAHILDRLVRYEAHLTRDVRQWLADLERWQARRFARHAQPLDLLTSDVPETTVSAKQNGVSR